MHRASLFRLTLLMALAACQAPAPEAAPPTDITALTETIRAREKEWSDAFLAADAAAISNLYTEDGATVSPAGEWDRGRAAIAAGLQKQFDSANFSAREDGPEEVIPVGPDYLFEVGKFRSKGVAKGAKAGTPETETAGRYVVLWRKDTDGAWRIHRDMGADAPPTK